MKVFDNYEEIHEFLFSKSKVLASIHVISKRESVPGKKTVQVKHRLSTDFCDELPCNSGSTALCQSFAASESRRSKRSELNINKFALYL